MSTSTTHPVVVGAFDSPTGRRAVEKAVEIARSTGSSLHLVTAVRSNRRKVIDGPGSDSWVVGNADEARNFLAELSLTWGDIETTTACVEGSPGDVLVSEAERRDASVIVVGNRRMQGAGRVLGAVANDVTHQAPCDVYVAHTNN